MCYLVGRSGFLQGSRTVSLAFSSMNAVPYQRTRDSKRLADLSEGDISVLCVCQTRCGVEA